MLTYAHGATVTIPSSTYTVTMKKALAIVFVVTAVLVVVVAFEPSTSHNFQLYIRYASQELSEDANETIETILIQDQKATYSYAYSGYHPNPSVVPDRSFTAKLTDEEFNALLEIIREYALAQNLTENQEIFDGHAVHLDLQMQLDGAAYTSSIDGMTRIWFVEGLERNIENEDYVDGAQEIIHFIEDVYES